MCGRCGQVWHVVMAKMGDRIAKVVCKRCGGHHRYRDENADARRRARRRAAGARRPTFGSRRATRAARAPSRRRRCRRSIPPSRRARTRRATATSPASGSRTRRSASAWSPARPGAGKVEVVFPARRARARLRQGDVDAGAAGRHAAICRFPIARRSERGRLAPARRRCASGSSARSAAGIPGSTATRWPARRALPDGAVVLVPTRDGTAAGASASGTRARRSRCASSRDAARDGDAGAASSTQRVAAALARRLAFIDRRRDRRLPLDPRRGGRAARRPRRPLRRRGERALRRRRRARVLPRPARAAARGGGGRAGSRCGRSSSGGARAAARRRGAEDATRRRARRRARRRDRGARERPALRRRPAARAEGRAVPRPARQPRAGADAGAPAAAC